ICVQRVLRSQAQIEFHRLIHHATGIVWDRIEVRQKLSGFRNGETGNDLDCARGRDPLEPGNVTRLVQDAVDVARYRHPRILLAVEALNDAKDLQAPEFSFAGFVTQRREGNRDLDKGSRGGERALRFHDDVDAEIDVNALGANAIHLHAERIEREHVGLALIVEGIEQDANAVFDSVQDVISLGYVRLDLAGLVEAMETDVEDLGVVTHHYFRRFRWRDVVAGTCLIEILERDSRFPRLVVELAVDDRRLFESGNSYWLRLLRRQIVRRFPGGRFRLRSLGLGCRWTAVGGRRRLCCCGDRHQHKYR